MATLYCGDNLDVMRKHLKAASVDLIYLDQPFKNKRARRSFWKGELCERDHLEPYHGS